MTVETSPDWLPPGWTREFRFQKTGRRITTAVKENKRLDWLPKDWLVEVKTRKSGLTSGRRVKVYVDPSTGLKFYSEPQVLRFLGIEVVIDKSTDDDLPSRWIKEVKIRRNVYGVRRYPKLERLLKLLFLPKKDNDGRFLTDADESVSGETSDRSILPDLDTETFEKGQSNDDYDENETEKKSSMDSKISCESKNKKELDLPQGLSNQLDLLEPKQVAAKQAYASTMKSHCGLTEKIIKPIEDADILGKQRQKLESEKTSDSKSKVQPLFSSEQCQELTMKTLKGGVPHKDAADEGLVSTPASSVLQEKNLRKTRMESKRSNVETKNSSKFKKLKKLDMTCRFSTPLAVLEQEQEAISEGLVKTSIANVQQQKSLIETRTEHSILKSSSKIEEPKKNQTVPAQMNDETPGQLSAIPFGSSWSDWSDSFFESPFKILASSSPAKDSFSFQRNFAPLTGQPVQQQQFPLNPPSLGLPKSSTTAAKKSYRKGKKKLPDKVANS
ncbi:hypothetical protein F3Y22_tig00113156pilonHSYRG00066 [Hibiscus syriacus]|uniref:MBD domain-containing protein n=1 Tax=Hibiscus syriacus TaxID=106335 RepID=A0A6A2WPT8_HIBSY|nr:hypothetical protein F3Y22_tig00113156pilonHSYRG00066 [Hibiscus syriacus]